MVEYTWHRPLFYEPKDFRHEYGSYNFQKVSFNALTLNATLAYAKDVNQALREFTRVLKPNGRLVFSATYDPKATDFSADLVKATEISAILQDNDLVVNYFHAFEKYDVNGHLINVSLVVVKLIV